MGDGNVLELILDGAKDISESPATAVLPADESPQAPFAFVPARLGSTPPAVNAEAPDSGASQITGLAVEFGSFSFGTLPVVSSLGSAQRFRHRPNQREQLNKRMEDANGVEPILEGAGGIMESPALGVLSAEESPHAPFTFKAAVLGSTPPAGNTQASGSDASQITGLAAEFVSSSSGTRPRASTPGMAQRSRRRPNQRERLKRMEHANGMEPILEGADGIMESPASGVLSADKAHMHRFPSGRPCRVCNTKASGFEASQITGLAAKFVSSSSGTQPGASSPGTAQRVRHFHQQGCLNKSKPITGDRPARALSVSSKLILPRPHSKPIMGDGPPRALSVSSKPIMGDGRVLERILNREKDPTLLQFTLLRDITNNFSHNRLIGYDKFGHVYKGVLQNGIDQETYTVTVKRICLIREAADINSFRHKVTSLMKINHPNVIRFLGFCCHAHNESVETGRSREFRSYNVIEKLMCFEYISNGSLDKHITDELSGLEWKTRFEIIIGICKGLHYLHEEKNFIHMELKPEDILLDGKHMVPKIKYFCLSSPNENSRNVGTGIGTRTGGYMAPEYKNGGEISCKSDIYNLGLIIIELVSGSKCIPDKNDTLRRWRYRWSTLAKKMPQIYQGQEQVTRCIEIGMLCQETDPSKRPSISDLMQQFDEMSDNNGASTLLSENTNSLLSSSEMTDQESETKTLEDILIDANAKPTRLSYPFIKFVTRNFSKEIGRGGFGVVYLGYLGTKKVAVKKLSILQNSLDKLFEDEIEVLIRTKHENIVRFLGYCSDTHGELVPYGKQHVMSYVPERLMCFEYVPNGNLAKYLKDKCPTDEWEIRYKIIRGICHGLKYLHDQHIIHLDLKTENILLDDGMNPKITDFGLARLFDEGMTSVHTENVLGTPGSIAPEIINSGKITLKADIYGLGTIIIKLLTGSNKFDFDEWQTSIDVDGPQVKSCIEIAQACVAFHRDKRPTIAEIVQKLKEIESCDSES